MSAFMRDRGDLGQAAAGVLAFVLLLVWAGDDLYRDSLLITMLTYALIALGMYVPFVLAGSLSLAYSAYAATGAYAVAIGSSEFGWPLWAGMLVGMPVAAAIAVVLGAATMRLSGFYLGAVTLLFAEAFIQLLGASDITGGPSGIVGLPFFTIGSWEPTALQLAMLGMVLTALLAFGLDRLRRSPWGVLVRTSREVPIAVDTAGVSVSALNLVALGVGAAIASLGGALFTASVGAVNPSTFSVNVIFLAVFMPLIGGVGSPWGAILGAGIVVHLTLNVDALSSSGMLLVSLSVLVILVLFPRGILGFAGTLGRQATGIMQKRKVSA